MIKPEPVKMICDFEPHEIVFAMSIGLAFVAVVDERARYLIIDARLPHGISVDVVRFQENAVIIGTQRDRNQIGTRLIDELYVIVVDERDLRRQLLKEFDAVLLPIAMTQIIRIELCEIDRVRVCRLQSRIERVSGSGLPVLVGEDDSVRPAFTRLLDDIDGACPCATIVDEDEI